MKYGIYRKRTVSSLHNSPNECVKAMKYTKWTVKNKLPDTWEIQRKYTPRLSTNSATGYIKGGYSYGANISSCALVAELTYNNKLKSQQGNILVQAHLFLI